MCLERAERSPAGVGVRSGAAFCARAPGTLAVARSGASRGGGDRRLTDARHLLPRPSLLPAHHVGSGPGQSQRECPSSASMCHGQGEPWMAQTSRVVTAHSHCAINTLCRRSADATCRHADRPGTTPEENVPSHDAHGAGEHYRLARSIAATAMKLFVAWATTPHRYPRVRLSHASMVPVMTRAT